MRLTQEHKELQRTIERFVENEINPHVATWEKEQMFPAHALFKKMGDLGLLGLTKPEEFGLQLFRRCGAGFGKNPLWGRTHGNRRSDRYGYTRFGAVRQRRTAP